MITARSPALTGILCALAGSAVFSINDVAVKSLSGAYALHQVILIRALIGMTFLFTLMALTRAPFRQLCTTRPRSQLLRVTFVMVSNVTYFLGLAVLPLADAVAIAFVSPLIVTILSVLILHEPVGPRRWAAVAAGFVGVIIMLRPGSGVFEPAAILVLISALCYACMNLLTRHMKATESAFALSFYVQIGFVIVSTTMGLVFSDGHLAGSSNPATAFLLRGWFWPPIGDWPVFITSGLSVVIGGLLVTQAYRLGEAALIAPFEYVGMPMAIFWGALIFNTWPDITASIGIALIIGAGLYTLWREGRVR